MVRHSQTSDRENKPNFRQMNTRLPDELVAELNRFTKKHGYFRDRMVERLLRDGLNDAVRREEGRTLFLEFEFPEEARVACSQYLIYFGEFLRDVGVDVETELARKAATVLFTVTPSDPRVALKKISEALDLYLSLPELAVQSDKLSSVPEAKLSETIQHLRRQLSMASFAVQQQQLTIDAQQAAIEAQKQLIQAIPPTATPDREVLFGGAVALTKVEVKGVEISLAEVFRRIRKIFHKRGTA